MTAKEYLMQYRNLNARINAKLERIMQLRALAEKRTAAYGKERVSGGSSDRYAIVARIADSERDLDKDIDRLLDLQAQIQGVISAVPDDTYRTLLELRYLTSMTWEQIAESIHCDRSWVYPLHGRALQQVQVPKDSIEIDYQSVI